MIGPDVEPQPRPDRDPLRLVVGGLAFALGAVAVSLAAAEWVWRQVRP